VIVSILKFRSGLTDEEVQDLYEARADGYRAVPGLVEKFYLRFRSGEHGAVYIWENEEGAGGVPCERPRRQHQHCL
jgi:hypothetical protein